MTTPNTPNAAERPSDPHALFAVFAHSKEYGVDVRIPGYCGTMPEIRQLVMERARKEGFSGDFVERMAELEWWLQPLHVRSAESVSAEPVYEVRSKLRGSVWSEIQKDDFDSQISYPSDLYDRRTLYLHPQPSTPGAVSDGDGGTHELREIAEILCGPLLGSTGLKPSPEELHDVMTAAGKRIRAALESFAKRSAAAMDDPEVDGTDAAHPAWWRSHDETTGVLCQKVNEILDGKDDGRGVSHEPWESVRRRLLALAAPPAQAVSMPEGLVLVRELRDSALAGEHYLRDFLTHLDPDDEGTGKIEDAARSLELSAARATEYLNECAPAAATREGK